MGLSRWLSGEGFTCQNRRHKRCKFNPWVWKIPWRRKRQPIPVFLPENFHGQRILVSYSPWSRKESDTNEHAHTHTHTHTHTLVRWMNLENSEGRKRKTNFIY